MQSETTEADRTSSEDSSDLFDVLASGPALKLLQYTSEPCTESALNEQLDVPAAVCERLLNNLVEVGLLRVIESTTEETGEQAYQREADGLDIAYADVDASVDIQHGAAVKNRIVDVWDTLADANS